MVEDGEGTSRTERRGGGVRGKGELPKKLDGSRQGGRPLLTHRSLAEPLRPKHGRLPRSVLEEFRASQLLPQHTSARPTPRRLDLARQRSERRTSPRGHDGFGNEKRTGAGRLLGVGRVHWLAAAGQLGRESGGLCLSEDEGNGGTRRTLTSALRLSVGRQTIGRICITWHVIGQP